MNRPQKITGIGCGVVTLILGLAVLAAFVTEGHAVVAGGHSTISEMFWLVWATQPWVIWLVSVVVAFIVGFLFGHFLAQSRGVYDDIRQKGLGS